MAINVGYFVKESLVSFKRNWVMSLGAIITIYLSLLIVGVSVGSGYIIEQIVSGVEQKFSIRVFLSDNAAPESVTAIEAELAADPRVLTLTHTTKEMALEEFIATTLEDSPEIVESLPGNPLPASIDLDLKNPSEDVLAVVEDIKAHPLFASVAESPDDPEKSIQYGQEIVGQLLALTKMIRTVGAVFIGLLGFISLIFINNSIRLAIYARRKEIGIMRLVGASNWFIRTPFLMEGVIQSLVGAFLAIGTLAIVWVYLLPRAREVLGFLRFELPLSAAASISLILIASGIIVGLIGSGLALRRYLKV